MNALLGADAVVAAVTSAVAVDIAAAEAVVPPAAATVGSTTVVTVLVAAAPFDAAAVTVATVLSCDGRCCCWPSSTVALAVATVSVVALCLTTADLTAVGGALCKALLVGESNLYVSFENQ